ncbi:hypothetical protein [Escherichia phage vB_EcoP_PAS7]|uniref:Uncharacterized protein n=1 Tax=Escherichia phage vB_EcoP_PAS7 TaxID=3053875 RepID=A0AA51Z019_9CAUD|nr:hypothetical protein [Escherichia phage vB_EcoP_PAS7]
MTVEIAQTKEVLKTFQEVASAVASFIVSLDSDEAVSVQPIKKAIVKLAEQYGADFGIVEKEMRENNDIAAKSEELLDDPLVYVRIAGTLNSHVGNLAAVIYDVEQSAMGIEVMGNLLGTVLILEEAY